MAVTVAVRVTVIVIGSVAVTGPGPAPAPATRSGAMPTTRVAAGSVTVAVVGVVAVSLVPMADALSRTGSMIVPIARSRTRTSTAAGNGMGAELPGPRPLGSEFRALMATRACSGALTRPRSGPIAAIDPPAAPVCGTATRSGRPVGAAVSAARPGAAFGTASARWLGGRVRGSLRRGHRPIIARTTGALCSPRPN